MDWRQLLSATRCEKPTVEREPQRTTFQRDFDRIVFSAAFRRLQDKTQVHPLPESDYIRRRLTHSLEVSCVGRSLGMGVGQRILRLQPEIAADLPSLAGDMGQVTANACLAHDIGNPPFGHAGEKAISGWFESGMPAGLSAQLTEDQKHDLTKFEGNAQGFRLLTRLQERRNGGGLRLSYATLAAFTKYPTAARQAGKKTGYIGSKKHGFFTDDVETFQAVAGDVGLLERPTGWSRHPLVFLVEAADDICYRVIDIEDAFKLGRFSFAEAESYLVDLIGDRSSYTRENDESENISWLRAKAIGHLIDEVTASFEDNYQAIMGGEFSVSLIEVVASAAALEAAYNAVAAKVFTWERTVSAEIAGGKMITDILSQLVEALERPDRYASGKLLSIVPDFDVTAEAYNRLLAITDFLSGMTDSYLQRIHRRLTGQSVS